jgi:rubrerythrin
MVNELLDRKGQTLYVCELCGFSYMDLETAESCEQYCYTHSSCSPKITQKAIRKLSVQTLA